MQLLYDIIVNKFSCPPAASCIVSSSDRPTERLRPKGNVAIELASHLNAPFPLLHHNTILDWKQGCATETENRCDAALRT